MPTPEPDRALPPGGHQVGSARRLVNGNRASMRLEVCSETGRALVTVFANSIGKETGNIRTIHR